MKHVHMTAHFDAPIEHVFELADDFKRYPEWNVAYSEVKEVVGLPDTVGTRFHAVVRLLGRTMEGWSEVVEVDRPRLLRVSGTSLDGSPLTYTYHYTPVPTGTDFVLDVEYELPAGFIGQIADKLFVERAVERDLRHTIENFKALVETKVPVLA